MTASNASGEILLLVTSLIRGSRQITNRKWTMASRGSRSSNLNTGGARTCEESNFILRNSVVQIHCSLERNQPVRTVTAHER